jgi:hypothetical protein
VHPKIGENFPIQVLFSSMRVGIFAVGRLENTKAAMGQCFDCSWSLRKKKAKKKKKIRDVNFSVMFFYLGSDVSHCWPWISFKGLERIWIPVCWVL